MLAIVSQAPALAIVVWLIMLQDQTPKSSNGHTNGNGANLELTRAIAQSLEKLADAQIEANSINQARARGFERWLDIQQSQTPFTSRKQ